MADLDMAPEALEILRAVADVDCVPADRQRLLAAVHEYDAVWTDFDMKLDREVLGRAHRLKAISTPTTGTDHIDKEEAARRGARVLCLAQDLALLETFTATAELAWLLLLACGRNFRSASRAAHAGEWRDSARFTSRQLSGLTLGVLGLGRLGRMVAQYGLAFRMRVLGCDRQPFAVPGVQPVDFDTLLRESDALSIHIHMTPDNYRLFDAEAFGKMKPGAILINTSRGDIIDEEALLASLESGRLAAIGADVLHDEWRADMRQQPLVRYALTHDNVVLTPHIGGSTTRSIADALVFSARKLVHYLKTGEELTMRH